MFAFIVILGQLASLNGQETTEQQQSAVECQQSVQESRCGAVTFVRDVLSARFQVDSDALQVGEEDEPE